MATTQRNVHCACATFSGISMRKSTLRVSISFHLRTLTIRSPVVEFQPPNSTCGGRFHSYNGVSSPLFFTVYKPMDLRKRMSCTAQSHLNHHGFLNDLRLTSACTLLAKNLPLRKYFAQNIMRYVISIKTTANSIQMDL